LERRLAVGINMVVILTKMVRLVIIHQPLEAIFS
jgi:hypothetical protein